MKAAHRGVWILAEGAAGRVARISFELLSRGADLAEKRGAGLTAFIMGAGFEDAELQRLVDCGADRVLAAEAPELEHFLVEPYAAVMLDALEKHRPEIVIAGATSTGRTLMPYVAAKADAGLTADCTVLDIEADTGNLLQTRPAIGGNILATIKTPDHRPQMASVRPHSTHPAPPCDGRTGAVERFSPPKGRLESRIRRIGFEREASDHPLQDAEIVVVAGRGVGKKENIRVVKELADALGAALGATRDVVDRGWLSYPHQVGLSGKTVTPKLYIGVGASGSIQHLAGMQTSENIIAVNIDPEAQMFRVADIGIVGDLFDVVPALVERIKAIGARR